MGLLEPDVRELAAVAGVPTQGRPPEPPRLIDQEEDSLENIREADEIELGGCGKGDRGIPRVERAVMLTGDNEQTAAVALKRLDLPGGDPDTTD